MRPSQSRVSQAPTQAPLRSQAESRPRAGQTEIRKQREHTVSQPVPREFGGRSLGGPSRPAVPAFAKRGAFMCVSMCIWALD